MIFEPDYIYINYRFFQILNQQQMNDLLDSNENHIRISFLSNL